MPPPSSVTDCVLGEHVGRDALRDDRRVRDRQLQLVGDDRLAHGLLQQVDLPRRVVRDAERPHLAGGLELVEGAGDLLGLDERVGPVQQQDVDVVGARAPRASRSTDSMMCSYEKSKYGPSRTMPALVWIVNSARSDGDELHRLGEATLAAVQLASVDVGVVDEVDPGVARRAHEFAHLVVGLVGDAHEAEDDVRRDDLGAGQGEGLHGCSCWGGARGHAARESPARSASSSSVRVRSTARTESVDALGPRGPGDRDDDGRERELPREGDLLRADAVRVRDLLERRVLPADVAGATDAAERRPRAGTRCRASAQCSSSPRLERNAGENWFCTETSRPPRISFASSIWATFAFEMPAISMTPSSSRSRMAPIESAYGTVGSGRWNW